MFAALSTLFNTSRSRRKRRNRARSPFSSPYTTITSPIAARRTQINERRRIARDYDASNYDEDEDEDDLREIDRLLDLDEESDEDEHNDEEEDVEDEDEDGNGDVTPLLPIFSAAHLDSLPVYNLTHSMRLMVIARVETTLTWDQLRSPQVSQFLVKPILQQIQDAHFSRATEYALMANCLQFTKEVGTNAGLSGTNKTRAMVCELIAMRLLKEFTTRELIDALAYDFDPLQGQGPHPPMTNRAQTAGRHPRVARTSCLEVAIRASAKRFLAHPLVVQQLEAIWAGSIVFHSAADNLHRAPVKVVPNQTQGYGSIAVNDHVVDAPSKLHPAKQREHLAPVEVPNRRSVTLYDPRDASLFKLSRLRVPRYRNIFSTLSFAILLGLFLAVLVERSLTITSLEILFWVWSAGYMLDEIVGFSEQGFSLYLASFWNTFDLGILMLLVAHLCLRIYGIVVPDARKHHTADTAYDVLAAAAVLLFPRLFSVLDHYRYFSQLLIAFRIMATDFLAIFALIVISCSGFFVALTLSFGNDQLDTPGSVAYALLQLLMGFTPAAWERWGAYNTLGKLLLVLFMFITHFLVVTILITVLTNSFMSIVQNANEEHQFLFAVNTISAVKSDSLFSYVAPTNIIGWLLTPLRYFVPFRRYVKLNRTVIKVTHFPILFAIFLYEKTLLRSAVVEPTDLVEARGRSGQPKTPTLTRRLFSPRRVREPSIATFQKDRALEEVFRRPFRDASRDVGASQERRKSSNAVNNWMNNIDAQGLLSPPQEQDRSVLDHLEAKKATLRFRGSQKSRGVRDFTSRSVASNPEDYFSNAEFQAPRRSPGVDEHGTSFAEAAQHTDADGDDELLTNEPDEDERTDDRLASVDEDGVLSSTVRRVGYFNNRMPLPRSRPKSPELSTSYSSQKAPRFQLTRTTETRPASRRQSPTRQKRPSHSRNVSTATILYKPVSEPSEGNGSSGPVPGQISPTRKVGSRNVASARPLGGPRPGTITPASGPKASGEGRRTPKKPIPGGGRARPPMPTSTHQAFRSVPNLAGMLSGPMPGDKRRPQSSGRRQLSVLDLGSDIGDNKAIGGGWLAQPGGFPASYTTQTWMHNADPALRVHDRKIRTRRHSADEHEDLEDDTSEDSGSNQTGMFGRLMLARMNNLEEGFREVVSEMRDHLRRDERSDGAISSQPHSDASRPKLSMAQSTKKDVNGGAGKGKEKERPTTAFRQPQAGPVTKRKKPTSKTTSSAATSVMKGKEGHPSHAQTQGYQGPMASGPSQQHYASGPENTNEWTDEEDSAGESEAHYRGMTGSSSV
ncbi:putative cation channel family [Phaeomoniella chlamydospora]|uniref:Putative cation channel family n=1 Tax=Phaeomoniella chlamydospora TaxID=158046 RepID=A0A0G2GUR8_PHACM|nr:putative cation channel family [Phaeomoniella chlamydospora]